MKDFRIEKEPTAINLEWGRLVFSGRYSVFDWGEAPGHVPNKGANLCLMDTYNFRLFDVNHVPTHHLGVIENGKVKELGECEPPPTEMAIELTRVPDLPHADGAYGYDACHEAVGDNYLIPLEITFRSTVPVGSNLRRRDESVGYGLELDEWPDEAVSLPGPVVEFSTKYEEQDWYLSRAEANDIAGKVGPDRLEELTLAMNRMLTECADETSFGHESGKIECLYHDGTVKVGNMVGIFGENRFSYGGQQVSKEVIRQYYKRVQPEWVEVAKDVKAETIETGEPNWHEHCAVEPDHLPADIVETPSDLYCAGADACVGHDWFDAPTIEDVVARVRDL